MTAPPEGVKLLVAFVEKIARDSRSRYHFEARELLHPNAPDVTPRTVFPVIIPGPDPERSEDFLDRADHAHDRKKDGYYDE